MRNNNVAPSCTCLHLWCRGVSVGLPRKCQISHFRDNAIKLKSVAFYENPPENERDFNENQVSFQENVAMMTPTSCKIKIFQDFFCELFAKSPVANMKKSHFRASDGGGGWRRNKTTISHCCPHDCTHHGISIPVSPHPYREGSCYSLPAQFAVYVLIWSVVFIWDKLAAGIDDIIAVKLTPASRHRFHDTLVVIHV